MKTIHCLFALLVLSACSSTGKIDFEGTKNIVCKNEKDFVTLQAAVQEVEKLSNGNYKVKDLNGSYIVTKGDCVISNSEAKIPEAPKEETKPEVSE